MTSYECIIATVTISRLGLSKDKGTLSKYLKSAIIKRVFNLHRNFVTFSSGKTSIHRRVQVIGGALLCDKKHT